MCWKQEWASGINNLTRAMIRIDRAKKKLEKREHERRLTNARALRKGRTDIAHEATGKLEKTLEGIRKCNQLIANLQEDRYTLLHLINEYGIAQSEDPAKTRLLMGRCTLCQDENDFARSPCGHDVYCGVKIISGCCQV